MDHLKSWALTLCTAAVACTLLYRLFPDSALGRQGRQLLSCLFLCLLLDPLSRWPGAAEMPSLPPLAVTDEQTARQRFEEQLRQYMNRTVKNMVNQALKSYGWEVEKATVEMDICQDGRIDMGQITLYVDKKAVQGSVAAVRQIAERRLGTAVTVVCGEEPNG